jgi:hypothetical protein
VEVSVGDDGRRCKTHNEFDGVAKRRIHEATERLAQLGGKLLGRKAEQRGQRDDGNEVKDEDGRRAPAHDAGDDADRHENEQDVGIVARQSRVGKVHDVLGERLPARLVIVSLRAPDERGRLMRAIGGSGHFLPLTACAVASKAVEVSLDGFWGRAN